MAVETKDSPQPDWRVPAGEVLAEALTERGWTQAELARRTDRPTKTINEIIKGKAAVTAETALQLELVLGIPARVWLNLERNYGEWRARKKERERLEAASNWLVKFPITDMAKHGLIDKARPRADILQQLLRFYGVTSQSAWARQWAAMPVALMRSKTFEPKAESLSVWLRWGELEAEKIECSPFNAEALNANLAALRSLTLLDPLAFETKLRGMLADCGVALVLVPEVEGTHLSGAARWLNAEKALVQLSLRHKRDDAFWFSVFHEIGHVLLGSRRKSYVDVRFDVPTRINDEREADDFAVEALVPNVAYQGFIDAGDYEPAAIQRFATEAGVAPGVVVGRLQHDGHVARSRLNYLKRSIDWAA